jgi:hypothetical protein
MVYKSRLLCTVDAEGDGRRGWATVRRGGNGGCSSMDGRSEVTLRRSWLLGTVEGGGVGSSGRATVRRGGEDVLLDVDLEAGRGTDVATSSAEADLRAGTCVMISFPGPWGGGGGRVKFRMTVSHSDMGLS